MPRRLRCATEGPRPRANSAHKAGRSIIVIECSSMQIFFSGPRITRTRGLSRPWTFRNSAVITSDYVLRNVHVQSRSSAFFLDLGEPYNAKLDTINWISRNEIEIASDLDCLLARLPHLQASLGFVAVERGGLFGPLCEARSAALLLGGNLAPRSRPCDRMYVIAA